MSQPVPISLPPGVVKSQSALGSIGRYIDCDGIRFWGGKPQKLGGQTVLTNIALIGLPRGACAWNDLTGRQILAVGTNIKLYAIPNNGFVPLDVTPLIATATLTNPFTTVNGSNLVTVAWAAHGINISGQYVDFSGASAVGGLTLNGSYPVYQVVDANNFTIQASGNATSGAAGGGTVSSGIEPAPGDINPTPGYGWGAGAWGGGTWNTPRLISEITFTPIYWSLDYFGRILLACPMGGSIYSWDPTAFPTPRATIVANAPTKCTGIVMTSDFILIAYGTNYGGTQNYMQWWASAQGNYANWDVTAYAGPDGSPSVEGVLAQGTEIVGAADIGNHVTLLWTDTSLYAFQFTGSQFVFDIQRVGKECGLIGPLARVVVDTIAYWMGNNGFYMYSGGVAIMPNQDDILDWVLSQIPMGFGLKTVASYNERYKEVWFEFVPSGYTEPTIAVVYNTIGQFWFPVYSIAFSAATRFTGSDDRQIFASADGYLYQMDNGLDVVGNAGSTPQNWFLTTAPMQLQSGVNNYGTEYLAIDMQRQVGTITAKISAYDRTPANAVVIDTQTNTFGPGDGTMDVRVCGRLLQATFSGSGLGCDVRFGNLQIAIQPNGTRN